MKLKFEIDLNTNCWIWGRSLASGGYGSCWYKGKTRKAHKVAYELLVGPVPEGMELDHICPNRDCINPKHLEVVTHVVNVRRGNSTRLSNEQAEEIIALNAKGIGYIRLAKMFTVHRSTICGLVTGRNWKTCKTPNPRRRFMSSQRDGILKKAA